MRWRIFGLLIILATLLLSSESIFGAEPGGENLRLKEIQLGEMRPLHVFGDIYLAGQPAQEDLQSLQSRGVKTIISVRREKELDWDEAAAVRAVGMKFVHVPFGGPDQLQPEVFERVLKALRDKRRRPTVLHCATSNRVGALWYAYRVLDGGLSDEAATKESQKVGLRTPGYLEKAQAYVEAVREEKTTP